MFITSKIKLSFVCSIMLKRVTSGGVHLRDTALSQRNAKLSHSGEPLTTVSDLTGPGIEPKTSSANSDVFYHYANFTSVFNFQRRIESPNQVKSNSSGTIPLQAYITGFSSAKSDISRYIFTDLQHSRLFTTTDFGRTLNVPSLHFKPDVVSIHPTKSNIVLALDKTNRDKALYKSDNFGVSWIKIQTNVKDFEWGYLGKFTTS